MARRTVVPLWSVLIAATWMTACSDRPVAAPATSGGPTLPAIAPASLVALAESTYFRAEYDSTRVMLGEAMHRATGDSALQARAMTWLGLVAFRQGDYATARAIGERALALKLRRRFTGELFRSYNALGLLAWQEGRFHDAIGLFGRAADAARTTHDSAAHATALGNLGSVQMEIGAFREAHAGLVEMQRVAHARGNARTEANATNNLGQLAIRMGDPVSAIELLARARALYRTAGSPVGEENALGQLGTAYDALGDPQRAFAYLDSALDLAQRHGLRKEAAEDLQLTAELYEETGDHQRALEYLARASRLADSLGARATQAMVARAAARAQAALGRLDLARERAGAAARLHGEAGARYERALDLVLLAEVSQRAGDRAAAQRALTDAVAIARELGTPVANVQVAIGAARVADAARDPRATLRALDDAQASSPAVRLGLEWEVHALRARAYASAGRTLDAIAEGRRAVARVERVRGMLASEALRSSYRADRAAVYANLVLALLRADSVSAAFEVADGARGRVLVDQLAAAQRDLGTDRDTRRVADAERLLRRIAALQAKLREADTARARDRAAGVVETETLAEELSRAEREYEALIERASGRRPGDATLLTAARTDAAVVRRSLASDEALVEFLVTPERLFTFVIRRDGVRSLESPISDGDLVNRVRLARDLIARGGDAGPREAVLGALHGILVAPAERAGLLRGARTLIVVPHSGLAYLPFAALFDAAHGRYLVESYAVSTMPSAAALADVHGRATTAGQAAAILAPVPVELPGTKAEALAVARATATAAPLLGPLATEAALRRALGGAGLVHVATHGVMNARSPMFSRLDLAPGTGETADDGRFEIHELLGMRVRSPLVFLSGCETALGTSWSTSFARGDDYATLSQAFFYAGARSVVATLWRIDDEGAAVFAAEFYGAMRTRPPIDALAAAQRALLRDPRYERHSSPRYWAAYVLAGKNPAVAQNPVRLSVQ